MLSGMQTRDSISGEIGLRGLAPAATPPTMNAPDPVTGAVTGSLNVTAPDGTTLTYTVTKQPGMGSLTVEADGTFRYTPSQLARLLAGGTLAADYDNFTVRATAGTSSVDVRVTPGVFSGQMATGSTTTVGAGPQGMVVSGSRMYVANYASNTVSVLDANTGKVIATVATGNKPTQLALNPSGSMLFIANSASNSVTAIRTTSGSLIATIPVASPQGLAMNPAGTRLYVTSTGTDKVSVINTANGQIVSSISVGSIPVGVAVSPDGTRVYVANRGSNTVSVINATNNAVLATLAVGTMPHQLALNGDGSRLFVTNAGSDTVSVLSTNTGATISTIAVGDSPNGITLSRDGSVVYVANGDNTLSVINAKTFTKVTGTLPADTGAMGWIAVSPDGNKLYIANSAYNSIRAVSLIHADPPPPTANPNTGPMFDDFNGPASTIADPDTWSYRLSAGGAYGEQQVYTNFPRNASYDGNGNLILTAIREDVNVPGYGTYPYSSAYLTTQDKFEFTYGTLSANVKFPAEQGLHPALWMLGSDIDDVTWPTAGEIDIMELYNSHTYSGSGLHGPGNYAIAEPAKVNVADDEFHEVWVRWEPNKITTGVDDTVTAEFTPDSLPPGTPWTYNDRSMYAVLNIAVGGLYGSPDPSTEFPASMTVDWINYVPLGV